MAGDAAHDWAKGSLGKDLHRHAEVGLWKEGCRVIGSGMDGY